MIADITIRVVGRFCSEIATQAWARPSHWWSCESRQCGGMVARITPVNPVDTLPGGTPHRDLMLKSVSTGRNWE